MYELLKTQSLISQGRFKAADAELNTLPSFKTRTLQAETLGSNFLSDWAGTPKLRLSRVDY